MQAKTQYKNTKELLSKNFPPKKSSLLQALHLIQKTQGFVSESDMLLLSKYLKVAKSEIFGAITSYPEIKTQIENDLKRCDGISCVINTKNIETKLETTDCKFKCFIAPIGYQNHKYYSLKTPTPTPLISDQTPVISSNSILNKNIVLEGINEIKNTKFDTYNKIYNFNAIKTTLNNPSEKIIDIIEDSKLRGRGGAYFPAAIKWKMASSFKSIQKYLIVNCEEGEPGVFKDRFIMENMPYRLIEGALIAAYASKSNYLTFYINGEAEKSFETIKKALQNMENNGIINPDKTILNSSYKLNIKLESGAGGYVCGEETTLINTMEGDRREPRLKPPFPTEKGVFGVPTVINNAETLCNLPYIMNNSPSEFKNIGDPDFPGTKLLSISGHFNQSGILEIPMGISINNVIKNTEIEDKKNPINFLGIGGPSSGILPKSEFDTKLLGGFLNEYGIMLGAGGFIGFNGKTDPIDVAIYLSKYNAIESCGKCTPCREGTPRMTELLENIKENPNNQSKLEELSLMAETINTASLCGLGQAAGNPVISYLKYFHKR